MLSLDVLFAFLIACILFYVLYWKMLKLENRSEVIGWYILAGVCVFNCFYSNIKGIGMVHYVTLCLAVLAADIIFSYKKEQASFITKVITFLLLIIIIFVFSMFS